MNGLRAYSEFLSRLGVPGPHAWIAGMEGLKNRSLVLIPPPGGALRFPVQGSCIPDSVVAEGLHHTDNKPAESLRPFFTKLYDCCGLALPEWYAS